MSEKPPEKGSSLEVDVSGLDEYFLREELARKDRVARADQDAREKEAAVKELARAEEDNASLEGIRLTREGFLRVVFFTVLTYFCLSAFIDFFTFFEGLKILGLELVQLIVAIGTAFTVNRSLGKIAESKAENGSLWKATRAAFRGSCILVIGYAITGTARTLPGLIKPGPRWNTSFIYLLLFFTAFFAVAAFLLKERRKIKATIRDYDFEMASLLSQPLGSPLETHGANRTQLLLTVYVIEGFLLNLGLMVFFQFAYGVNVPMAVLRALSSPAILLFFFSPMLTYVFFRRLISDLYY